MARSPLDQSTHVSRGVNFHVGVPYAKEPDMSNALSRRMGNDWTLMLLEVLILIGLPLYSCPSKVTGMHLLGHMSKCSSRRIRPSSERRPSKL